MKRGLLPLLLLAVSLLICGCTRNNGDIGPLFGFWKMEQPEVSEQTVWSFQGEIVKITVTDSHHESRYCFGLWSQPSSDQLQLDFSHNIVPEYSPVFTLFEFLDLPNDTPFEMRIIRLEGSYLEMEYEGRKYVFKKVI